MKNLLRIEEAATLALSIYLASLLDHPLWLYAALFLAPDLGMLGYLVNPRVGAFTYNILHHKGIAIAVYLVGAIAGTPTLMFTGALLLGHSAFDRMVGYGLKYPDSFHNTHLGLLKRPE